MTRAVVTGGAGFLGSHIADVLTERGNDVVVLDRVASPHIRVDQTMVVGDLSDESVLRRSLEGAQTVFHMAALADLNAARTRPTETAEANIVGTVRALELALEAGVERFVLASTVYVYSRKGGFYRVSKQACEAYVEEYGRQEGLEYTILRYGSLYGPRSDQTNGVHRLLRQALVDGRVEHPGSPEDKREYIHVRDAAELSVDAAGGEYANQRLIITGHHPTRIGDLFTMFSEILGREVEVSYGSQDPAHYSVTPYAYAPAPAHKLTSNRYVDMGEGLMRMVVEIDQGAAGEDRS